MEKQAMVDPEIVSYDAAELNETLAQSQSITQTAPP